MNTQIQTGFEIVFYFFSFFFLKMSKEYSLKDLYNEQSEEEDSDFVLEGIRNSLMISM